MKARQPPGICGESLGQDLQRYVTVQPGISRAVDLTHPADAKGIADLERAESETCGEWQSTELVVRQLLPQSGNATIPRENWPRRRSCFP